MSNFMQDAVVSESLAGDVWKQIVVRYVSECRQHDDDAKKSKSAKALKDMVNKETEDAKDSIEHRPFIPGESDAERGRRTQELLEALERAQKNVLKNYLPVIIRAEKDGIPLLNHDGKPKGRSALEREYKEVPEDADDAETPQKDPLEVAQGLWRTLNAYCVKHSLDINDIIG